MPRKYSRKKSRWNNKVKRRRRNTLRFQAKFSKAGILAGALALLFLAGWLGYHKVQAHLLSDSQCNLTKIEVRGATLVAQQEIISLAQVPLGTNIFSINLAELENRLLANPMIRNAKAARKWPSSLAIMIEERKPVARILENGTEYLVDSQNKVIKNNLPSCSRLPLLTGLAVDDQRLPQVTGFLDGLHKYGDALSAKVTGMTLQNGNSLMMELSDGLKLSWGDMAVARIPGQLARLELVMKDLRAKTISSQYIDLRFKNVVVKPN